MAKTTFASTLAALAALALCAAPAQAQQTAAAATPPPPARTSVPPAVNLSMLFDVKFRGMTAGEFDLTFTVQDGRYQAAAARRTTGLARSILGNRQDYTYSSNGEVVNGALKPAAYQHRGGRRDRTVRVAFGDAIVTTSDPPGMGMGNPPATEAQKRGAIDQLTALASMLVASGSPCRGTIPVYMDGRSRFDFVMRPNGRVDYRGAAWRGQAVRCTVQFRPIAGFSDPQEAATLTFLFAPLPNGVFAPLQIEMPSDDGIFQLEAKRFRSGGPA
ncbi:MAG: DUF3108 domain-containing protein [Hyphomonadaceae bacterium]|nr:DUF3108 domain-containing protein [Hyphomonadaceae bacterium]